MQRTDELEPSNTHTSSAEDGISTHVTRVFRTTIKTHAHAWSCNSGKRDWKEIKKYIFLAAIRGEYKYRIGIRRDVNV